MPKKKTFKDVKIKKPEIVVEEVTPPPIESVATPQQPDPMMLLMQATAQLAQGINTMLEWQKLQTDALLSIKDSLHREEEKGKISEQEMRALQEEKPLQIESRTYYIKPLMWYDVDQNPIYNDAIWPTFKSQEEAEAFAQEKIGAGKYRIYHVSSIAARV